MLQDVPSTFFPGVPIELYEMIPLAFPTSSNKQSPCVCYVWHRRESHHVQTERHRPPRTCLSRNQTRELAHSLPPKPLSGHICKRSSPKELASTSLTLEAKTLFDRSRCRTVMGSRRNDCHRRECTAGKLSSWFTSISGSSGYYQEGVIVYSNEAKNKYCGVSMDLIHTQGAVCKQVAIDLARGIQERSGAVWGMGITESQVLVVALSKSQLVLSISLYMDMVKATTLTAHSTERETK